MAPKKNKPNGFMIFMKEKKAELEAAGHRFPGGIGDKKLFDLASSMWKELTIDVQDHYKAKAKHIPAVSGQEPMRYDSKGVPLAYKEREEQNKKTGEALMSNSIQDTVHKLCKSGELTNHYFHFLSFNYAVETEEGGCIPCEIAIVKFSLACGICETYHEYIDPGKIPIGYSFEAKDNSSQTHKIDLSTFGQFNGEYPQISNQIRKLLTTLDGGLSPVYVLEAEIPRTRIMLDWLARRSCETDPSHDAQTPVVVSNINRLFYELRRYADLSNPRLVFPTMISVDQRLRSTEFDYFPNMACQYHEDSDNSKNCALTCVRRHAYVISDMCCESYHLRLLPNRHCPANVADETLYVVQPAAPPPQRSDRPVPRASRADDSDSDEATPRYPRSTTHSAVGSRLAARFSASTVASDPPPPPGSRASSSLVPAPPSGSGSPAQLMGRGRGRGSLFLDFLEGR